MENSQSPLKEKSILPAILVIGQIFLIIIIISIVSLFVRSDEISEVDYDRQPKVAIEGLSSALPDPSEVYIDVLETKLAKTIALNESDYNSAGSKAIIRDGTFKLVDLDKDNVVFYSMIIDIPNLEQSYQIYDHYSGDKEPANRMYILCLDGKSQVIYPNFNCKDGYSPDIRTMIGGNYLKYFNFPYFTAFADSGDPSLIKINPVNFDIDTPTRNSYIDETKDAINSLGISPDLFTYKVLQQSDLDYNIPPEYQ